MLLKLKIVSVIGRSFLLGAGNCVDTCLVPAEGYFLYIMNVFASLGNTVFDQIVKQIHRK